MPVTQLVPIANSLLASLPRQDYRRLYACMEPVHLHCGDILYEAGDPIRYIYFPNDCLVSLLAVIENRMALEVGMVGYEGMVGIPVALESDISPVRAMVQGTGIALRMTALMFRREFRQNSSLQHELYRYINVSMVQLAQAAICNRSHMVDARLARWLLMTRDRMRSDHFHLTQELLGNILGVRRVSITKAAHSLSQQRLISYSRGNITILDGKGLEAASCSCYGIAKRLQESI